jgi:hypothetical protein
MKKKSLFLAMLAFGLAVTGCDDGSTSGDDGGGIGCSSLSSGTQCHEQSSCSSR